MEKRFTCLLVLTSLVIIAGCGPAAPTLVPASGTVTYNGQPLEGASVVFMPDEGMLNAGATTDAAGKFTLQTSGKDGAPAGSYKVVITKTEGGGAAQETFTSEEDAKKATMEMAEKGPAVTTDDIDAIKSLIPERYNTPATSGFTATVKEDGSSTFEFALDDS